MHTQLLCTFTTQSELDNTLEKIYETYRLVYNYIYILQNKTDLEELFITYNIDSGYTPEIPMSNTILVHRKKESNTLYTINALNELVKEENNGVLDRHYLLEWTKFKNCIIVTNTMGTKKLPTRIFDIIDISEN
jgi:hypothetical protein